MNYDGTECLHLSKWTIETNPTTISRLLEAAAPAVWSDPTCFITSFDRSRKRFTLAQTPLNLFYSSKSNGWTRALSSERWQKEVWEGLIFCFSDWTEAQEDRLRLALQTSRSAHLFKVWMCESCHAGLKVSLFMTAVVLCDTNVYQSRTLLFVYWQCCQKLSLGNMAIATIFQSVLWSCKCIREWGQISNSDKISGQIFKQTGTFQSASRLSIIIAFEPNPVMTSYASNILPSLILCKKNK